MIMHLMICPYERKSCCAPAIISELITTKPGKWIAPYSSVDKIGAIAMFIKLLCSEQTVKACFLVI